MPNLTKLNISDAFCHNVISGVGMGSGAPNLSNISITNSTFTQDGNGTENGDGDISLFGFLGNATLENLIMTAHQCRANDAERRLWHSAYWL